eukprot:903251-Amphidinium_carterae.1
MVTNIKAWFQKQLKRYVLVGNAETKQSSAQAVEMAPHAAFSGGTDAHTSGAAVGYITKDQRASAWHSFVQVKFWAWWACIGQLCDKDICNIHRWNSTAQKHKDKWGGGLASVFKELGQAVASCLRPACGLRLERSSRASLGTVVLATLGVVTSVLLWRLKAIRRRCFEFGDVDITKMTSEASRAFLKRDAYTSLIPEVVRDLEEMGDSFNADAMEASAEVDHRAKALAAVGAPPFRRFLQEHPEAPKVERRTCTTLQLNIGLYCNQACTHCHVESSPLRKEMMSTG